MKNDYLQNLKQIISKCGIDHDNFDFIQKRPTEIVLNHFKDLLNKGNISNYEKFQELIKKIEANNVDFIKFLQPLKSNYDSYLFSTSKSICQICLMVPKLSNFLIDLLINKVCELSINNNDEDNELAILCLNQFKWNIYNKNMDEIVDKLLDLGYISNSNVQNHLISIFPDICQGKSNTKLTEKLYDWMSSNNSLISASLETINKLDLPDNFIKDVELLVMNMLDSATMNNLPALITFLIKSTDKANLLELIDKVRLNIEFDNLNSMFTSAFISTPLHHVQKESSCALTLINSIKINLQFNSNIRKIWLKSISNKPDIVRSPNFDFIILLIIFNEYKTESGLIINIMKSKIARKQFTTDTLETMFKYHFSILKPLYSSFFLVINSLIANKDPYLEFTKSAYLQAFTNPNKEFIIDKVFNCLIMDISVKSKSVIDGILEILHYIAENCRNKIQLFYLEICSLLSNHHLEFSCSQIYHLYSIIGVIAFQDLSNIDDFFGDEKRIRNEVILLIKKQLQNPNFIVRRNGGIGAVTVMKYLSNVEHNSIDSVNAITHMLTNNQQDSELDLISNYSDESEATNSQKIVSTILKLLLSYSETVPELIIVVFDELYRLIFMEEMVTVEKKIRKIIINSFKDSFTFDICQESNKDKYLFGLVGSDYCDIAIVISKSKSNSGLMRKTTNIHLPAFFRLLALFELRNKSLSEINALLGCPIMFDGRFDLADPIELLTLINWLIEVVNAFSSDISGGEIDNFRFTMMQRMKSIVEQISDFERNLCLQGKPIKLPIVQGENLTSLIAVTEVKKISIKRKPTKRKKSNSKKSKENPETSSQSKLTHESDEELFDIDKIDNSLSNVRCKILEQNLYFCFRELDLSVFAMLSDLAESDLILSTTESECLGWKELRYYLSDLLSKIKHCLRSSTGFPAGFSSPHVQRNGMLFRNIDQLDTVSILQKLISMKKLFKLILSKCITICQSDEIFESAEEPCFLVMELILNILSKIFHFLNNNPNDLNEEMAMSLISGLAPSSNSSSFLNQLWEIREKIPNVNIASAHCELVSELLAIPNIEQNDVSLLNLTVQFLGNNWNPINIANYKSSVSKLFEIHLSLLSEKWFEVFSINLLPEMQMLVSQCSADADSPQVYICLDKNTVLNVFKLVSDFILRKCKDLSKITNSQRNTLEILESWEKLVTIIKLCTVVISNNKESNMMLNFIKFSREFIKFIIKNLMPILDNMLRHENAKVIKLLTEIQFVTRFIQRLCTHCKQKNNLASASLVPQVRRYLETFMFRVKKMMCINKCSGDSINILFLTNKDIHGRRIEESVQSDNDEEENEENNNTDISEEMDVFSDDLEKESLDNE